MSAEFGPESSELGLEHNPEPSGGHSGSSVEAEVQDALNKPSTRRGFLKNTAKFGAAVAVGGLATSTMARGAGAQEASAETGQETENIVLDGVEQVRPEHVEAADRAWLALESEGRVEDVHADLTSVNQAYRENSDSDDYEVTPPEQGLRLIQEGDHYSLDYVFKSQPPQMDIHIEAYAIYPLDADGTAPQARAVLLQTGQEQVDLKDDPNIEAIIRGRRFSYIRALMSDGSEVWLAVATNNRFCAISQKVEEENELIDQKPMPVNTLEEVGDPAQPQVAPKGLEGLEPEVIAKPETIRHQPDMLPHTEPSSTEQPIAVDAGEKMGSYEPVRAPLEEPAPANPNIGFVAPEASSHPVESIVHAPATEQPLEVESSAAKPAPISPRIGFMPPDREPTVQSSPISPVEAASQGDGQGIKASEVAGGLVGAAALGYELNKPTRRKQMRQVWNRIMGRGNVPPQSGPINPEMGRP